MALKLSKKKTKVKKIIKKSQAASNKSVQASAKTIDPNLQVPVGKFVEAVGRRKVSTARVRLYEQGGDFVVNNQVVGRYFDSIPNAPALYNQPFEITGTKGKFGVNVRVSGSGVPSQLDAVVHGIARALIEFNPDLRPLLKEAGMLTRDSRMKETRKVGTGGKARRKRQSPKR